MKKLNQTLIISSISVAFVIIAIIANLLISNRASNSSSFQVTWSSIIGISSVIISLAFGAFQVFDKAKEVHTKTLPLKSR